MVVLHGVQTAQHHILTDITDPATDGTIYTATAVVNSASVILAEQYDCEAEASVVVDTRLSPDLDFIFSGAPCTGENVQVDISGAESYSWVSNPNETGSSVNPDGSNPDLIFFL